MAPRHIERAGDPEIRYQRVPGFEQDVLGLDVAVDDVVAVRVAQGVGHLPADLERLLERELPLALEPLPQRLTLDERHDVVEEAGGFAGVVEGQDVGVAQARREANLPEKPLGAEAGGELGAENLESDRPVVLEVAGEVHHGHAARAEFPLDRVAGGEGGAQDFEGERHGRGPSRCRTSLGVRAALCPIHPRSGFPHSGQNFGEPSTSAPQPTHVVFGAKGVPHSGQNLPP